MKKMGLSSAVDWWEVSQLRVLVISSLIVQWILLICSVARRYAIPGWSRKIIWLAYIGGDAVAIYGLATLFNRHKNHQDPGSRRSSILEVVWAPVLLMHLGGNEGMTAHNLEDNELWTRHAATAVSQTTVAIYVFSRSWQGGDTKLLVAAILLFYGGILKCVGKPWALKAASFNSMVSYADRYEPMRVNREAGGMNSLEEFVRQAREHAQAPVKNFLWDFSLDRRLTTTIPARLLLDLACPDRLSVLQYFCGLDEERQYFLLQVGFSNKFAMLYTKRNSIPERVKKVGRTFSDFLEWSFMARKLLPLAAIFLFHTSHRESYNDYDVKVTYALFICTAVQELFDIFIRYVINTEKPYWPGMVSQYSFIGFLAGKIHCNKPCLSSRKISSLVVKHLKDGWKRDIENAMSYWKFNDQRGQGALKLHQCNPEDVGWNIKRPFDESVLVWHIATDICFYSSQSSTGHMCTFAEEPTFWMKHFGNNDSLPRPPQCEDSSACKAVKSRKISNYMMYLLVEKPDMLLPGARTNLFETPCDELKYVFNEKPSFVWKLLATVHSKVIGIFKSEPREEEMQRIVNELGIHRGLMEALGMETITDKRLVSKKEVFIRDAWELAEKLKALGGEKMWDVIQGVWVEMLCFSAGRCRGFLHAKALGTGGELLSYVWLLMLHMGMETITEKLQREPRTDADEVSPPATSTAKPPTGGSSEIPNPAATATPEITINLE